MRASEREGESAIARFVQAATHTYTWTVHMYLSIFMGSILHVVVISCCAPNTQKGPKSEAK